MLTLPAPVVPTTSVYPSGGALAPASMPIETPTDTMFANVPAGLGPALATEAPSAAHEDAGAVREDQLAAFVSGL